MSTARKLQDQKKRTTTMNKVLPREFVVCSWCDMTKLTPEQRLRSTEPVLRYRKSGKVVPQHIKDERGITPDQLESHGMCDRCADGMKKEADQRRAEIAAKQAGKFKLPSEGPME